MKRLLTDTHAMRQAARRLSNDGIWIKREYWTDEDGMEVPADHPAACNRDFIYEVDYDRIVALVVDHLADAAEARDWTDDPTLGRAETLARFEALDPQPTRSPQGQV